MQENTAFDTFYFQKVIVTATEVPDAGTVSEKFITSLSLFAKGRPHFFFFKSQSERNHVFKKNFFNLDQSYLYLVK